jgi:Spy/CpxP family protein refolding chaperone
MKFNKALVTVLFLTIFFAGAVALEAGRFWQHHDPSGIMGPVFRGLKTIIQLDLSDSQKLKIMSILEKYENERESLKESLGEERQSLVKLLKADQFNEDEIRSALRRAAPIREELLVMRMKMVVELKRVLTPEQLQLLGQRKAHRIERLKARIGPRLKDTNN